MPVLYGVFLYMGVTSLGGVQVNYKFIIRTTQHAIPPGSVNEYQRKLGSKRACHAMH